MSLLMLSAMVSLSSVIRTQGDPRAEVFRLQLQRFEGTYNFAAGRVAISFQDGALAIKSELGPSGTFQATAGYSVELKKPVGSIAGFKGGTSAVEGRTLSIETPSGPDQRRLKLVLKGREEVDIVFTKRQADSEQILFSGTGKRGQ